MYVSVVVYMSWFVFRVFADLCRHLDLPKNLSPAPFPTWDRNLVCLPLADTIQGLPLDSILSLEVVEETEGTGRRRTSPMLPISFRTMIHVPETRM